MTRAGKLIASVGASVTMLGLVSAPAHAASQMYITHSITVTDVVTHQIDVHLPMSKQDAEGYIYWGAKIKLRCWGSDAVFNELLDRVPQIGDTFSKVPRKAPYPAGYGVLKAAEDGLHLTTLDVYRKPGLLNEDIGARDEVFCDAKWIDADGYVLKAKSEEVTGYF
jgi:hypothetical protein